MFYYVTIVCIPNFRSGLYDRLGSLYRRIAFRDILLHKCSKMYRTHIRVSALGAYRNKNSKVGRGRRIRGNSTFGNGHHLMMTGCNKFVVARMSSTSHGCECLLVFFDCSTAMSLFGSFLLLLLILVEAAPPTASSVPILGTCTNG